MQQIIETNIDRTEGITNAADYLGNRKKRGKFIYSAKEVLEMVISSFKEQTKHIAR